MPGKRFTIATLAGLLRLVACRSRAVWIDTVQGGDSEMPPAIETSGRGTAPQAAADDLGAAAGLLFDEQRDDVSGVFAASTVNVACASPAASAGSGRCAHRCRRGRARSSRSRASRPDGRLRARRADQLAILA
ncbi:hypothetical protein [Rhizobacter sp. LjRoot28]|uniref:hypothetical protein n=1 Tax=Rhizobacter sp. LjRoot28 TaxID=3342309 RepID=UPI003ECCF421